MDDQEDNTQVGTLSTPVELPKRWAARTRGIARPGDREELDGDAVTEAVRQIEADASAPHPRAKERSEERLLREEQPDQPEDPGASLIEPVESEAMDVDWSDLGSLR